MNPHGPTEIQEAEEAARNLALVKDRLTIDTHEREVGLSAIIGSPESQSEKQERDALLDRLQHIAEAKIEDISKNDSSGLTGLNASELAQILKGTFKEAVSELYKDILDASTLDERFESFAAGFLQSIRKKMGFLQQSDLDSLRVLSNTYRLPVQQAVAKIEKLQLDLRNLDASDPDYALKQEALRRLGVERDLAQEKLDEKLHELQAAQAPGANQNAFDSFLETRRNELRGEFQLSLANMRDYLAADRIEVIITLFDVQREVAAKKIEEIDFFRQSLQREFDDVKAGLTPEDQRRTEADIAELDKEIRRLSDHISSAFDVTGPLHEVLADIDDQQRKFEHILANYGLPIEDQTEYVERTQISPTKGFIRRFLDWGRRKLPFKGKVNMIAPPPLPPPSIQSPIPPPPPLPSQPLNQPPPPPLPNRQVTPDAIDQSGTAGRETKKGEEEKLISEDIGKAKSVYDFIKAFIDPRTENRDSLITTEAQWNELKARDVNKFRLVSIQNPYNLSTKIGTLSMKSEVAKQNRIPQKITQIVAFFENQGKYQFDGRQKLIASYANYTELVQLVTELRDLFFVAFSREKVHKDWPVVEVKTKGGQRQAQQLPPPLPPQGASAQQTAAAAAPQQPQQNPRPNRKKRRPQNQPTPPVPPTTI